MELESFGSFAVTGLTDQEIPYRTVSTVQSGEFDGVTGIGCMVDQYVKGKVEELVHCFDQDRKLWSQPISMKTNCTAYSVNFQNDGTEEKGYPKCYIDNKEVTNESSFRSSLLQTSGILAKSLNDDGHEWGEGQQSARPYFGLPPIATLVPRGCSQSPSATCLPPWVEPRAARRSGRRGTTPLPSGSVNCAASGCTPAANASPALGLPERVSKISTAKEFITRSCC